MDVVHIRNLIKDYGNDKGIFDISFDIKKGEVFGFLGPNGAGKTTTIRNLMGFIKPDSGECFINGLNTFKDSSQVQLNIGYIPGETAFMNDMTGIGFIQFMAHYRGLKSLDKAYELMKRFDLDAKGKIKKMSKGMKQKIAIVIAFMHDPDILILDEPTSGLDPLMQNEFIKLIKEEKEKGKTILMSSHMFEEVEKTCTRVAIIKKGKIVITDTIDNLKRSGTKKYMITFKDKHDVKKFQKESLSIFEIYDNKVIVNISGNINELIRVLNNYDILDFDEEQQHLEDTFMEYYGGKND